MVQPLDPLIGSRLRVGVVEVARERRVKGLGHKAALATAADTRHAGQNTQRKARIDVFQIV